MTMQNRESSHINANKQNILTPELLKSFKNVTCECGGLIFEEAVILKKISALITPSGREELYPLEVLVCKKCGKIPKELDVGNILPDEIIATKTINP